MNLRKLLLFILLNLVFSGSILAQNNYLQEGINLYNSGKYDSAIKKFKSVKKQDTDSYLGFYYLGLSYEKQKNIKKALKAFKESVEINDKYANSQTALAYMYYKREDYKDAIKSAKKSILIDSTKSDNFWVIGLSQYKLRNYGKSVNYINKFLELKPDFPDAHLLKYKASIYMRNYDVDTEESKKIFKEGHQSLVKFIILTADSPQTEFWKKQQDALLFFANYYRNRSSVGNDSKELKNNNRTGIKILSKPRPGYTTRARNNGIKGVIRAKVVFQKDGTIGHILIVNGLGYGLDENVIEAIKKIKFEPEIVDGKPKTTVKTMVFGFNIG